MHVNESGELTRSEGGLRNADGSHWRSEATNRIAGVTSKQHNSSLSSRPGPPLLSPARR